jgi:hypothetical protein
MALISVSLPVGNLLYGVLAELIPLWSVLLITAMAYGLSVRPIAKVIDHPVRKVGMSQ